ncbi:MAG: formate/nitrite transporter family protein [Alistipes sp.]|nr:formate/nitrite transporter family protein [Alistipes sp.]
MKKLYNTFALAVMSGIMIGFGGVVFLMCENRVVGSLLFSFGLLTIVCQGFALYTGRVGYFRQYGWAQMAATLAGNFVGTFIMAKLFALTRLPIGEAVQGIVATKLADSTLSVFVLAVGCGAMMYLAVDNYRKSKSWLFVIMPIVIFILSGFEHSIANMFYLSLAGAWGWEAIRITIIAILGNALGSWMVNATNFLLKEE